MFTRTTRNTVGTLATLAGKSRPTVTITLDGQEANFLKSYTTRDEVKGAVAITAPMDCRFEEIYITLEGQHALRRAPTLRAMADSDQAGR
jgi:hypothetical protein